jgi:two-component system, OmpR family, phosphate regulon sensor histidine kinase PhoR
MGLRWVRGSARQTTHDPDREHRAARESLERTLASVQVEYDALLDRCGAATLVLDSNGMILRCNADGQRLLGVRGASLVGLTLLAATLSDELDRLFKQARLEGSAPRQEVRAPSAGGCILEVEVTPVLLPGEENARYLLVAQDITERRKLEMMRRDFVANVSHELRTPLASIRAMAETLQDGALSDPAVAGKFLGTIVTETDRLARIAEDLLVLSDAESHQPEIETIDISELVEFVFSRSRPQAEKAGLLMTAEIAPGLTARANRDQIEQVLVNLVDNAIKYTGEGGSVLVSAAPERDQVLVSVTDTGIGIMSQDVPRIFERFYRVDKARSRQSGGTGLGLSIVKHIVESHGGTVSVQSEYNRGSTFTFTLPVGERR